MKSEPLLVRGMRLPTSLSEFGQQDAGAINLAGCENSMVSERAMAAVKNASPDMLIKHWNSQDRTIRQKLGEIYDVDPSNVYLTSGAAGAIGYSFRVFVEPSARVGLLQPDYTGFEHDAERARAEISWLKNLEFPYTHANDDIINFVRREDIGFLITSNPSAVTGTLKDKESIEEIVRTNPEAMHIIDEADTIYPELTSAGLTKRYDNLVILGSFAKFYGLAGVRIGWLITPQSYSEHFDNMISPIELTSFAIVAAQGAIDDKEHQKKTQERVEKNLIKLEEAVRGSQYRVAPGSRCFASYLDADTSIEDPYETLARFGVPIAKGSTFGLSRGGRVTLSEKEEDIDKLAEVISKLR
jgi:histidinol-phosphate aminotransferase